MCTRGLLFKNSAYAPRFVEWIEMLRMLGADKFVMYVYELARDVEDILKYYEEQGTVEAVPWSMSAHHSR